MEVAVFISIGVLAAGLGIALGRHVWPAVRGSDRDALAKAQAEVARLDQECTALRSRAAQLNAEHKAAADEAKRSGEEVARLTERVAGLTEQIEGLAKQNSDTVITEEFETSLTIIRRLLSTLGIHPSRIDRSIQDIRQQHYEPLLQQHLQGLPVDEAIEATVRKIANGKSIEDLGIRQKSGATVVAVEREGTVISNPGPQFRLQEEDRVHLIGSEQEVSRAISLL